MLKIVFVSNVTIMTKLQCQWTHGWLVCLFVCLGNSKNMFRGEKGAELSVEQLLQVMSALSAGGSSVIRSGCFPRLALGNVSTVTH